MHIKCRKEHLNNIKRELKNVNIDSFLVALLLFSITGYKECVFHPKINNVWVFSWRSLQHYSCLLLIQWLDTSDVCIISCGFMVYDKSSVHHMVMCKVVSCGSTNLFVFDMLRCWEDVGVRGAFEDPVQRFQLLLGEGICPKMFP